ncbi:hypothetical protein [Aurantivibrio plasticivorans]
MKTTVSDIRTKKGHRSQLNYKYNTTETLEEVFQVLEAQDHKHWDFDYLLDKQVKIVQGFLRDRGVPSEIKQYQYIVDSDLEKIIIDGKSDDSATLSQRALDRFKSHNSPSIEGTGNITSVLKDFYEHVPGTRAAANFFHEYFGIQFKLEKQDKDGALVHTIRAMRYLPHLVIAEMEDFQLAEKKRQAGTSNTDRYIFQRYIELQNDCSLNNMALIISQELEKSRNHKSLSESSIRKKLQGKNLENLRSKFEHTEI